MNVLRGAGFFLKKSLIRSLYTTGAILAAAGFAPVQSQTYDSLPGMVVWSLAVAGDTVFAGTNGNGVMRSFDDCVTWKACTTGLPEKLSVSALTLFGGTLFAGTSGSAMYSSTDFGDHWSNAATGLPPNGTVSSFAVCNGKLYAGAATAGVLVSADTGHTWKPLGKLSPDNATVRPIAVSGDTVAVGTLSDGLYISTDQGASWHAIQPQDANKRAVTSLVLTRGRVIAGTVTGLIIVDINRSFEQSEYNFFPANDPITSMGLYRGTVIAGVGIKGLYLSSDDGYSWMQPAGLDSMTIFAVAANDSNLILGGGSKAGIFRRQLSLSLFQMTLSMKQEYACPTNYYTFTLENAIAAASCELYANGVPLNIRIGSAATQVEASGVISTIESGTGKKLSFGDTIVFNVVAKGQAGKIVGISNSVYREYVMYIGAMEKKTVPECGHIRVSGTLIDCSSLQGEVAVALYTLSGKKVWSVTGAGIKALLPAGLPQGGYLLEVRGNGTVENRVVIYRW